ncbi:hypothetical protein LCGC14_0224550 [marine sediment metagenome]|uniref:ERCC4 domain-containing protein n=1 Tax=marine sediment metagenome TaxID=412755 RepID=A0A0F9WWW5_9ZZZZ|nr:hypothetical protein [bacterium]
MTDQKLAILEVKVDVREPDDTLEKVLTFCPLAKREQLEIGDIVYKHVAIELKSWVDFINAFTSRSDDRYRRQLYNFLINKEIEGYYVIYGDWEEINDYSHVKMTAVLGAIASIQARYGMRLMILPNKDYAIYTSLKIIEKTFDHKDVRPVVYKVGTDERAIDMLVAAGNRIGSSDAIRLLSHFKTAKNVVNATSKQLQEVKKVGKVKADNLIKTFNYDFKAKKDFEDNMNDLSEEAPKKEEKVEKKAPKRKPPINRVIEEAIPIDVEMDIDIIDIEADRVDFIKEHYKDFDKQKRLVMEAIDMYTKKIKKPVPLANLVSALPTIGKERVFEVIQDLIRESMIYEAEKDKYEAF